MIIFLIDAAQLQGLSVPKVEMQYSVWDSRTYITPYGVLLLTNKRTAFRLSISYLLWHLHNYTFEVCISLHYHLNYRF